MTLIETANGSAACWNGLHISKSNGTTNHAAASNRATMNGALGFTESDTSLSTARKLGTGQNDDQMLDMICVGFGPASLAIAIAVADTYTATPASRTLPKVLFLEKQDTFAWHAGMQLPEAKMQISFLKDLATPRDPTSPFTFLNYLHAKGRLNQFINLGTFLPSRVEYQDYLRWCAEHFESAVAYGKEVTKVESCEVNPDTGRVYGFKVYWQDCRSGKKSSARARHVIIAAGGKPFMPPFSRYMTDCGNIKYYPFIHHSSMYASVVKKLEVEQSVYPRRHRFVVVGAGQSAAEIFNDLWSRFPDAQVSLIIKGAALRPSDDSPFVNEIFDPSQVDVIYSSNPETRRAAIKHDRGTNYGVVRLTLLEHIYEKIYMQRIQQPDETQWRCRIIPNRTVVGIDHDSGGKNLRLRLEKTTGDLIEGQDEITCTHMFTATGYVRNAHEEILKGTTQLLPPGVQQFPVSRNYKVQYDEEKVDGDCGVWLQGCNESTHGLSDSLLSILAIRGGEMVTSIFGAGLSKQKMT